MENGRLMCPNHHRAHDAGLFLIAGDRPVWVDAGTEFLAPVRPPNRIQAAIDLTHDRFDDVTSGAPSLRRAKEARPASIKARCRQPPGPWPKSHL